RSSSDDCYLIATRSEDPHPWSEVVDPLVRHAWRRERIDLSVEATAPRKDETARVAAITEDWLRAKGGVEAPSLPGVDLRPGIARHLRVLAQASPALARRADAIASAILGSVRPTVVGFSAIGSLSAQLLADRM